MRKSIEFVCFVNNTGFAHAAIDYGKAMRSFGADVSIKSAHNSLFLDSFNEEDRKWINECSNKECCADYQFRHVIPSRWANIKKRKFNSALAVFESTNPPREWINSLKQVDLVVSPSNYCADVFWAAGLSRRPYVVPHAIDVHFWDFSPQKCNENSQFKILSIGTWRARKNWKNIIRGFEIASQKNDFLSLTIKTDRGEEAEEFIKNNIISKNIQIDIIADDVSDIEMRRLIRQHDCILSASIGEGFCISPIQAMACGIPVICSAVGGCLEYALDENCIRIETRGYARMSVMDNIPQFRNQEWAVILAEDVADSIEKIITMGNEAKINMIDNARLFVENNFSYNIVGRKMMEIIFGSQA